MIVLPAEEPFWMRVSARMPGATLTLTAFHGAQALIFMRTGKVAKTHRGVHGQFAKLAATDLQLGGLHRFLSHAYNLKAVADYAVGPDADVPLAEAAEALETAAQFVDRIAAKLEMESGEQSANPSTNAG